MNTKILLVTKNSNDEILINETTVLELINSWASGTTIPTNDDEVVRCVLGETNLYFDTFGQLMKALSGEKRRNWTGSKRNMQETWYWIWWIKTLTSLVNLLVWTQVASTLVIDAVEGAAYLAGRGIVIAANGVAMVTKSATHAVSNIVETTTEKIAVNKAKKILKRLQM